MRIQKRSAVLKEVVTISIAKEEEILEYLTSIMRRDDEEIRFSDSFKAAELLGKYYGIFSEKHSGNTGDVIIVDNIPGEKNADAR